MPQLSNDELRSTLGNRWRNQTWYMCPDDHLERMAAWFELKRFECMHHTTRHMSRAQRGDLHHWTTLKNRVLDELEFRRNYDAQAAKLARLRQDAIIAGSRAGVSGSVGRIGVWGSGFGGDQGDRVAAHDTKTTIEQRIFKPHYRSAIAGGTAVRNMASAGVI